MPAVSPYETALILQHARPNYTPDEDDSARVASYWTYEDMYRNAPSAYAAILRDADGEEISRRYVAGARTVVEGTNRYFAKGLTWVSEVPLDVTLSPEDRAATMQTLQNLFKREEFGAKFLALKRWMLIRGDALLHISADPLKAEGTRIRISELSPEHYFPLVDPVDSERVTGCYIVQIVLNDDEEEIVQRIEYRRILTEDDAATYGTPIGTVFYRLSYWETDKWDDRWPLSDEDTAAVPPPSAVAGSDALALALEGYGLDPRITSVPVYHFRNNRDGGRIFGVSELQGIETLLAGQTQVMTDEDIAVALQGIGVFWTDSGRPMNRVGGEAEWVISPAAMLELEQGGKIGRVDGGNIDSMLAHHDKLGDLALEATGTPQVAVGRVDVEVAESGVALAIQFAPTTAKNEEKEEEVCNKLDQMVFDLLNMWLPVFEGIQANGLIVTSQFSDPLPVNREAVVKEVTELVVAKVISKRFAAQVIKDKLGYDIAPEDMVAEVLAEDGAALDQAGARMAGELGADPAAGGEVV